MSFREMPFVPARDMYAFAETIVPRGPRYRAKGRLPDRKKCLAVLKGIWDALLASSLPVFVGRHILDVSKAARIFLVGAWEWVSL
jgi:hypothetical protein